MYRGCETFSVSSTQQFVTNMEDLASLPAFMFIEEQVVAGHISAVMYDPSFECVGYVNILAAITTAMQGRWAQD